MRYGKSGAIFLIKMQNSQVLCSGLPKNGEMIMLTICISLTGT